MEDSLVGPRLMCSPVTWSFFTCASCLAVGFGCWPRNRSLAWASLFPARVQDRTRSASSSAIIARAVNRSFLVVPVAS